MILLSSKHWPLPTQKQGTFDEAKRCQQLSLPLQSTVDYLRARIRLKLYEKQQSLVDAAAKQQDMPATEVVFSDENSAPLLAPDVVQNAPRLDAVGGVSWTPDSLRLVHARTKAGTRDTELLMVDRASREVTTVMLGGSYPSCSPTPNGPIACIRTIDGQPERLSSQEIWLVAGAMVLATIVSSALAMIANRESQRAVLAKMEADANLQQAIANSQRAQESEAKAIAAANLERIATQRAEAAARAEREAKEAEEQRRLDVERQKAEIEALNSSLRKQKEDQRRIAYVGQMNLVQKAWEANNFDRVRELLNATRPGPGETDLRGLEWHYWQRQIHPTENAVPLPEGFVKSESRFSADGRWFACVPRYSGDNAEVLIVDVSNGAIAFETTIALGPKPPAEELADGNTEWSQSIQVAHVDDRHIAVAVSNYQTTHGREISEKNLGGPTRLKVIRRDTKETLFEATAKSYDRFCQFVFSRDGNRVAAPLDEPLVKVWDIHTGEELHSIPIPADASIPRHAERLALNHDGTQLAIKPLLRLVQVQPQGVQPFGITLVDLATGKSVATPSVSANELSYSMDSTRLIAFLFGSTVSVFEPTSGKKLASFDFDGGDERIRGVSPDGKWLVVEKGPSSYVLGEELPAHWIEIVDSSTGHVEAIYKGFSGWVNDIAFSPDGRSLVTVLDQGIVTWTLPTLSVNTPDDEATRVVASPDGRWLVSIKPHVSSESQATETDTRQSPRTLLLSDIKGQKEDRDLPIQESILGVSALEFSSDGSFFAAVSADPRASFEQAGELKIWETESGREILSQRVSMRALRTSDVPTLIPQVLPYRDVAFPSDNRRLAVALPVYGLIAPGSKKALARSDDSQSGFYSGMSKVHVWDVLSGGSLRPSDVSIEIPYFSRIEFNQSGIGLLILPRASGGLAKSSPVESYDAKTGQRLWRHDIFPLGVELTQDHSMIVAVVQEQAGCNLVGWYTEDGRVAFRLPWSPEKTISRAIQSDDQKYVAILSGSNVHVVDVASSIQRVVLAQSGGDVLNLAFSKDGKRLVTSFGSAQLRLPPSRRDLWPKGISIWDSQTGQEFVTLHTPKRSTPVWDSICPIKLDEQSISVGNEVVIDIAPLKNKTLIRELTLATRDILFAATSSVDDDQRARQFIQEVYALEPSNVEVASLWALAHFRAKDSRSAMQGILAKDGFSSKLDYPKSSEAYTLRALVMHYQGNRDQAMELLKQAQISSSQDENLWLRLVREVRREMAIPLASSQPDQWIGHPFMPRQFKSDGLLPLVATKVDGDRLQFGDVFLDSVEVVRLEDALAYYTAGLETHSRESEWWNYRGATRDTLGEFDQAIEDYTRAIEIYADPAYFVNRGNLLAVEKNQFEPAVADFQRALGIRSSDARAHASLARTYRQMGKLDKALESANAAIRLETSNGSHYCKRAYIHAANGKLEAMRADFESAIAVSPDYRRVWQQRAWLLATSTDDQHRDGRQAVLDATKACELTYWIDAESLDHLAAAYAEVGDFAQAIPWQEKAIALTPIAKRPKLDVRLKLYKQHKPYREPLIQVQPTNQ